MKILSLFTRHHIVPNLYNFVFFQNITGDCWRMLVTSFDYFHWMEVVFLKILCSTEENLSGLEWHEGEHSWQNYPL